MNEQNKKRRNVLIIVIVLVLIVIVILGIVVSIVYGSSNAVLFQPKKLFIYEPNIPHQEIMIEDRLSAWYFNNFPGNKTILFCHSNYGNISYTECFIEMANQQKLNLLVFDYSGYGKSNGIPDQKTVCRDGESAYNYLVLRTPPEDIIIWGMSMGGGVATYIASRNKCNMLILMSTFSSLDDMILDSELGLLYKIFAYSFRELDDTMKSKERIKEVNCPVIIMHSRDDEIIPFMNARRLFENIRHGCKIFIEIAGKHAYPIMSEKSLKDIFDFCCLDSSGCHLSRDLLESLKSVMDRYLQMEEKIKGRLKN